GAEDWARPDLQPVEMTILGADAEFMAKAPAAMLEQDVEGGFEAVAVVRMQPWQPVTDRSVHGAGGKAELRRNVRRRDDLVACHIPVPDDIAGACQRQ